jgi:hypothetical protein
MLVSLNPFSMSHVPANVTDLMRGSMPGAGFRVSWQRRSAMTRSTVLWPETEIPR